MNPFDTIQNNARVQTVSYQPHFSAICSIGRAPFHGTLEIEYKPEHKLLEFESFERWLRDDVSSCHVTIEDLCRLVFDVLHEALGDIPLRVSVAARTTVHAPVRATIATYEENQNEP